MTFDLTNLSPKDLDALISNAKQRKVALKKRKPIADVREKLAKAAKAEGYSLDELFAGTPASAPAPTTKRATKRATKKRAGKRAAKRAVADKPAAKRGRPASSRAGGKVAPKYRNPDNPAEVWSGRGMTPRWMVEHLKQGKTRDDFLI